ncbi:MAG: hypothetical protein ACYCZX_16130, partial [Rhodospirillaceae bacterium]
MKRIGFLYNHDTAHQVRHSAGAIAPLGAHPDFEITVLATSGAQMDAARDLVPADRRCSFVRLELPAWHGPPVRAANLFMPLRRLDNLYTHRDLLRRFDALVVTEGTSLFLKKLGGFEHVKFIR